ncbi:MAG: plasmid stabilization protein [Candidatus Entotheonella factor]|uniref:Plasmid stabilization protein n=1 Tax=Entotheonella factor TaxID=1429438 RepID=W4LDF9_ENTF1|nr:type II toxin-antitoxin system mRNA interferase toxin, RelE/StbE family [Candidatus Entotheonella palauensis]ETW95974.1 MAG: plasmid stabilization protein [Candidatus Entotheonella factor]
MRALIWGGTFVRALKRTLRKNPSLQQDIENTLRLLAEDPFVPQLATHKLKGKLAGSWACSVTYDLRIVFDFVKSPDQDEDDILLLAIGSHNEVY